MLVYAEGKLVEIGLLHVVIHISGFGYRINVPLTTIERMPAIGDNVKLYIVEQIREDLHELYGFFLKDECEFFETLVNRVSGIGYKTALTIMSRLSINTLKTAITTKDISLLSKCHGIGKKTAERIIVELADKIDIPKTTNNIATKVHAESNIAQDAVSALISLGYKPTEADKAIQQSLIHLGEEASSEELIKYALHL